MSSISVGADKFEFEFDALQHPHVTLYQTPGVRTETVADLLFAIVLGISHCMVELAAMDELTN